MSDVVLCEASRAQKIATLIGVVVPFLGLIVAIILLYGSAVTWVDLVLLATFYTLTGLGVTMGFHRLFTHRSFQTVRPIELFLAILGSMSAQGPLLQWTAFHRKHHQFSDRHDDPHSPHTAGSGLKGFFLGVWHSHVGWLFEANPPDLDRYVPDLRSDRVLRWISDMFPLWVLLGLVIPAILGGLLTMSWYGALFGFIWGGLARICLVHHLTWCINSVCHIWGQRPYASRDLSRNNVVFGVLAFGEGWHNNHHAFPTSARHGLAWWQFDLTYVLIWCCEKLGLAWKVRLPSQATLDAKRQGVAQEQPAVIE